MSRYYNRETQPITMEEWITWFEVMEYRRVALDVLDDGTRISTVWMGLDHQYGDGPPLIFETMVFSKHQEPMVLGGRVRLYREEEGCWRYTTEQEAIDGHKKVVQDLVARNIQASSEGK